MIITINKNSSTKEIKKALLKLQKQIFFRRSNLKKTIINNTFGKVNFDFTKTPLEIQKEMRDEWN